MKRLAWWEKGEHPYRYVIRSAAVSEEKIYKVFISSTYLDFFVGRFKRSGTGIVVEPFGNYNLFSKAHFKVMSPFR